MNYVQDSQQQIRSQLIQIFRYVQAFNHLQNPVTREIQSQPWSLWFHDLPKHPCICSGAVVGNTSTSAIPKSGKESSTGTDDFLLKVRRPELTDVPEPPREIVLWLHNGWQNIDEKVTIDTTINPSFHSDSRHTRLLEEWIQRRNKWIESERPVRQAMNIFEKLYALRAQMEREAERLELMLGDGLLLWQPTDLHTIHHPILLLRLQLHFDPQIPEFILTETEQPAELYTALFQSLSNVDAANISHIRQDFEKETYHPLGADETTRFLKRFVNFLSSKGEFYEQPVSKQYKKVPVITRDPVLFLRNRTLGFSTAIEAILEALPTTSHLSPALTSLVHIEEAPNISTTTTSTNLASRSINEEDEQILLSKPANAEQLEIARRLESQNAVLVQGPPGTGKTHTIANLLGHLLAQGKSVLVTSHTPKALKVLQEKVVKPLQPLCVSLLEEDSRTQMESAIDAITEKLTFANVNTLEAETRSLTRQRIEIISQLRAARLQLKDARNSEYQAIVIAGQQYTPAEAARYVSANRERLSWLPLPVSAGVPLPLSYEELIELYHTNISVSRKDEQEMIQGLPQPSSLVPPVIFDALMAEYKECLQTDLNYRRDLWDTPRNNVQSVETFKEVQHQLVIGLQPLEDQTLWHQAAITAGREGGPRRTVWDDLIHKIEIVHELAAQAEPLLFEYDPILPTGSPLEHIEKVLTEIVGHIERASKLSGLTMFMHKEWKAVVTTARVKGRPPETVEHFKTLLMQVQLQNARTELLRRWQKQMTALGGPEVATLGNEPERACKQYVYHIRQCIEWYEKTWLPLEHTLIQSGLRWEKLLIEMPVNPTEYGDLRRLRDAVKIMLPDILTAEVKRRAFASIEARLSELQHTLNLSHQSTHQAEVVQQLREAVRLRDAQRYRGAFSRLVDLYDCQKELQQRHILLAKLEKSATGWAKAICNREGIHGQGDVPPDPEAAWIWRQLHNELDRRAKVSLEALQTRITQLSNKLHISTAELVEKKAWVAQMQRTTPEQRRALQTWKELMRKIGKGTGKRAPHLRAEARKLMPVCQTAIPVWIMPLSRVVQNFDPRRNHFDVVIIDEASQADIKALTAVYMGKQIVIVGDHEQVTPMGVGQKLDDIEKLIDEYLPGIPSSKLYDGKLSIYALAQTAFPIICLREHFRCVSPIIQFSNQLSYEGKIKPLRDDSDVKRRPATVAYRVKSSGARGHVNEEEAYAVASLLIAATQQSEYKDATFGVISMISTTEAQALRIDTLLRRYLSATEYTRRQILCGNPAQFQGDERDIIFISIVDTPKGDGPLDLRSDGSANDYMYRKRFNVAASRARDQLWVVHSLDPDNDLKEGDIRKRLIKHATNPKAATTFADEQEQRAESEFEKQVMRRLLQAGYHVVSQWPVGSYRIDMVVEGAGKRLAIECDGDRWHPIEKLEADMARQAILERLGWRFVRIRGSQFFRNPSQAMEPVFARLQALDIPPIGTNNAPQASYQQHSELKERIIRRAAELQQAWLGSLSHK